MSVTTDSNFWLAGTPTTDPKTNKNQLMRKLSYLFLFIYLCTLSNNCLSQTQAEIDSITNNLNFYDTLNFVKPSFYKINSVECLKSQFLDSLKLPWTPSNAPYLLYSTDIPALEIAIKNDNGFTMVQFQIDQYVNFGKSELIDFSGNGKEDVLIKWKASNGVSRRDGSGGNGSQSEGFIIINLRNYKMVANFTTYKYDSFWTPDTLEETCYRFIPEIKAKEIIFSQSRICKEHDDKLTLNLIKPIVIKYTMKNDALIKIKN